MKRHVRVLQLAMAVALLLPLLPLHAAPLPTADLPDPQTPGGLLFIENAGQLPAGVRYYVHGAQHTLWLGDDGLGLVVPGREDRQEDRQEAHPWDRRAPARPGLHPPYTPPPLPQPHTTDSTEANATIRVRFTGAAPGARIEPFGRLETRVHVYPSADPATWRTDVPAWSGLRYRDLLPGVDLEIASAGGRLTWRWVCRPAALDSGDTCSLPLRIDGAGPVRRTDDALWLSTPAGEVALSRPGSAGAALFADPAAPQGVSDNPAALMGGTFIGGSRYDSVAGLAVGADGTVYAAGSTASTNDGFSGAHFVTAFSPDLRTRRFITFLGGLPEYDALSDLALDAAGNVYVTGTTSARDFPVTPGAYDTVLNDGRTENCPTGWSHLPCPDAFAARLNGVGQLTYATYLGGAQLIVPQSGNLGGDDYGISIRADDAGNMVVVGQTDSDDFPTTPGAFDRAFSYIDIGLNPDVFVVKLRPLGQGAADLLYGTYVGAGFVNQPGGMALDAGGAVYVTGSVQGSPDLLDPKIDFPTTPNAYPHTSQCLAYGCQDVFFFKLNPAGQGSADMLYSTFFGGTAASTDYERGNSVALGDDGTAYLTGYTSVADFPTTSGAFAPSLPPGFSRAAFVARMSPAGQGSADMLYSTYLGGNGSTYGEAVAVAGSGAVYVAGSTGAYDFPFTPDAFDTSLAAGDAFVTRLALLGQGSADLVYSTFLGGSSADSAYALSVDDQGIVYAGGSTGSWNFPVPTGGSDPTYGGGTNGYLVRLMTGTTHISGRLTDGAGQPLAGITVRAGSAQAVSGSDGRYTLSGLQPGTYTVTPSGGYLWAPAARTLTVPPAGEGQDFTGYNIDKAVAPSAYAGPLQAGDTLTYTVRLLYPTARSVVFYDRVPTYTTYVSGSLSAPAGLSYDAGTGALQGTLDLEAIVPVTVTFSVHVAISGTADFAPILVNRACAYPSGGSMAACTWSNEVRTFTYAWPLYLPLVMSTSP